MKKVLLKKLRSNEGASLTFAIMLFLVCAVIGTIVLTAGTIASGRLAEKAEMDKRYYHVVSVAEFLKDTLDNRQVVIVREKNGTEFSISVDGYKDPVSSDNDEVTDENIEFYPYDFLTLRSLELLSDFTWDADYFSTDEKTAEFEFQVSEQEHIADIKTTVKNGMMIVDIYDYSDKDNPNKNYKVRMTFAPHVSEVVSKKEDVETKTATITWSVSNIEKVFGYDG